jgi:hypothetical protein
MKKTNKLDPNLGNTSWSIELLEKVHNCADCPIREMGIKQPQSVFAKLHAWHMTWWPAWKAHQARTCAYAHPGRQ